VGNLLLKSKLTTFETTIFRAGAQPALHFEKGAIFMKFHSMMSSCLFNRGTTFSQTVKDIVLFPTFPKIRSFEFYSRCRPNDQDRV